MGPDGGDAPAGADELYCDALGRVRIRYHWQDGDGATCWVRVAQRLAGGGIGSQFLPRIGQEVVVQFIENDIDRPIYGTTDLAGTPLDLSARVGGFQLSASDVAAGFATRAKVFAAFGNGAGWDPQP